MKDVLQRKIFNLRERENTVRGHIDLAVPNRDLLNDPEAAIGYIEDATAAQVLLRENVNEALFYVLQNKNGLKKTLREYRFPHIAKDPERAKLTPQLKPSVLNNYLSELIDLLIENDEEAYSLYREEQNKAQVRKEILDLQESIIADPGKGQRMIEGMSTGSVVLSWIEYEMIQNWILMGQTNGKEV